MKELNDFLTYNACAFAFVVNLKKQFGEENVSKRIKEILTLDPVCRISHAFDWDQSEEGENFWTQISQAWVRQCDLNKKADIPWISVSDGLPKDSERVLIHVKDGLGKYGDNVHFGSRFKGEWQWERASSPKVAKQLKSVTHWARV